MVPPTPMPPNGEATGSAGSSTTNPPGTVEVPESTKKDVPEGRGTAGAAGAGTDTQH